MDEPGHVDDIELIDVRKSRKAQHKYDAIFQVIIDGKKQKDTVSFGATGFVDYTLLPSSTEEERAYARKKRKLYIGRHIKKESELWEKSPMSKASLSRWILWGDSQNIEDNIRAFKDKFKV
jgi:hypothetical protein